MAGVRRAEEYLTGKPYPNVKECLNCGVPLTEKTRPDIKPPLEQLKKCLCVECIAELEKDC